MRNFPYRTSTLFAKEHFKSRKDLICVEIGVWKGENSKDILDNLLNIKTLYLIDPWNKYSKYKDNKIFDNALKVTRKRLKKYQSKIKIIRKASDEAIKDIPNNIDFIYIDGNHKYKHVKQDIENYYKKLRKGGILAGHDISWFPGVAKAFCEFIVKYKLDPIIRHMDWMVIKK
ncbi:MAG: class I SAM-dependent methyltransferase [Candidatus Pacearchaeota archaeon]